MLVKLVFNSVGVQKLARQVTAKCVRKEWGLHIYSTSWTINDVLKCSRRGGFVRMFFASLVVVEMKTYFPFLFGTWRRIGKTGEGGTTKCLFWLGNRVCQ